MNTLRTTLLAAASLLAACSGQPDEDTAAGQQQAAEPIQEATPAETAKQAPPSYADGIAGTVVKTMNSGGYTYLQVDTGGDQVWAAVPQVAVAEGDQVKVQPGMPMQDYTSKTLGQTFDVVYFSSGLASSARTPMPANHSLGTGSPRAPAAGAAGAAGSAGAVDLGGLARVEGGQTVAEVFAGKDALAGNEVVLRAKVVKFTGGIMGTNFLHVQDGTGGEGTNDLTVTSKTIVGVGDTVLVRGVLVANKDFGFGYQYDLIIENAELTVE